MKTKVSIVEDNDPYREHLAALIGGSNEFECTGAHRTAELCAKHISEEKPDLVLLDLELPKTSGLELIPKLKEMLPKLDIVVLTMHKDPQLIFGALEIGACGYLVKPALPVEILEALSDARAGGAPMSSQIARLVVQAFQKRGHHKKDLAALTKREQEVLELIAQGQRDKEIGDQLKIAPRTVATHLRNIYEKLHVNSRGGAAAKYFQARL